MLLLMVQFGMLVYVNLTQMHKHIGYDASGHYLTVIEMWKQKTWVIKNFERSTSLLFDTSAPLAVGLMAIFKDIFLAYGMANVVIDIALIVGIWLLAKALRVDLKYRIVILCIILCPYLGTNFNNYNDLMYFSMMYTNCAAYNVKLLLTVLYIWGYIRLQNNSIVWTLKNSWKHVIVFTGVAVCLFISGASSGYYLGITVILPCMLYGIIRMFQYNDLKYLLKEEMLYNYCNIICLFAGKFFAEKVLHYTSFSEDAVLIGLIDFWNNLGDIFLGYISLFYGLRFGSDYGVLSKNGILYLCKFILIMSIVIFAILGFYNVIKKKLEDKGAGLLGTVITFHIVMYSLILSTYGATIFESRYLIQIFFMMVFLSIMFLSSLSDELLVKKAILLGILICLSLVTVDSYKIYLTEVIDVKEMQQIKETVAEVDSPVIYTYDWADLAMNMRVFDTDKVYKIFYYGEDGTVHIGHSNDYTYYDDPQEHLGAIMLMTTPQKFYELPESVQGKFTIYRELDNVNIWYSDRNIFAEIM